MRKVIAPKVPESGVLKACLDLLAAERIWHRRWNTGAVKTGNRFFRFGKPGDGDILALPRIQVELICDADEPDEPSSWMVRWVAGARMGLWKWKEFRPLWIECKGSAGQQTPEQKSFEQEVREQGHHYLLVRDVDTLRNWLKEHGI